MEGLLNNCRQTAKHRHDAKWHDTLCLDAPSAMTQQRICRQCNTQSHSCASNKSYCQVLVMARLTDPCFFYHPYIPEEESVDKFKNESKKVAREFRCEPKRMSR